MQIETLNHKEAPALIASSSLSCWYAVHTYSQNERMVAAELEKKGVETFLPLQTELHQWSDRKKRVQVPLFSCYAFVRMAATAENCARVLHTPRVLRLLGANNEAPTPVPEPEIESARILAAGNVGLSTHAFLRVGQRVRICGGSLEGVEGIVTGQGDDRKLVVSVNLIQQSVALSLHGYRIEPV